jgi:hypothetical protein
MFFKKKNKKINVFKLSDESIEFIKTYLLNELNIATMIDMDILDDFVSVAFDWESEMVDENGHDKTYEYPNKTRNEMADRFVSEVSGKLSTGLWIPDFDDINKRLGLI